MTGIQVRLAFCLTETSARFLRKTTAFHRQATTERHILMAGHGAGILRFKCGFDAEGYRGVEGMRGVEEMRGVEGTRGVLGGPSPPKAQAVQLPR